MIQKNIKIFCGISIIVFVILNFLKIDLVNALSYAVSVAVVSNYVYDRWLWRINCLENTPKLYGVYDALFISNYQGRTIHSSVVTIKQTLSSISIFERADEGYSIAVTTNLLKDDSKDDPWHLYFTYRTHPNPNDHDDAHHGTALMCVTAKGKLEGSYYTNRNNQTKGRLIMIRRKNPKIACPIDPSQYLND